MNLLLLEKAKQLCNQVISADHCQVEASQLDASIREITGSDLPLPVRIHLICAFKSLRMAMDHAGNVDLSKLPEESRNEIREHIQYL